MKQRGHIWVILPRKHALPLNNKGYVMEKRKSELGLAVGSYMKSLQDFGIFSGISIGLCIAPKSCHLDEYSHLLLSPK